MCSFLAVPCWGAFRLAGRPSRKERFPLVIFSKCAHFGPSVWGGLECAFYRSLRRILPLSPGRAAELTAA